MEQANGKGQKGQARWLAKCLHRFLNVRVGDWWLYNFKLRKGSFEALPRPAHQQQQPASASAGSPAPASAGLQYPWAGGGGCVLLITASIGPIAGTIADPPDLS